MAFLLPACDQAKYRHLIAQPSGFAHVPTTACICLDRLLRSAVQHACHAAFRQRGSAEERAGRAAVVGQFLLLQWHEAGGDFPGQARTGHAPQRRPFDHAALLVLRRLGVVGGAHWTGSAAVSDSTACPSRPCPPGVRQPHATPAMAESQPPRLASGLIPTA